MRRYDYSECGARSPINRSANRSRISALAATVRIHRREAMSRTARRTTFDAMQLAPRATGSIMRIPHTTHRDFLRRCRATVRRRGARRGRRGHARDRRRAMLRRALPSSRRSGARDHETSCRRTDQLDHVAAGTFSYVFERAPPGSCSSSCTSWPRVSSSIQRPQSGRRSTGDRRRYTHGEGVARSPRRSARGSAMPRSSLSGRYTRSHPAARRAPAPPRSAPGAR